ncbi:patatin-like phospholipase family protein [Sphingomonas fuzhouensis]|uniref:patatin-like phospholipase family protein n=1 Tax=Sphingomonas fuzhouensis TaxID=3106033 RepID=UPI002AFDF0D3|nr:patatin-like phospholipase family protein [Sphingomonas sp. SGZ-02]
MTDRHDPTSTSRKPPRRPRVALALQGGGAHGAYGWGVIERLLEEDIDLVGVSGASAGAINGAALVSGYAADGADGARTVLERLWHHVADASPLAPLDVGALGGPFYETLLRRSLDMAKLSSRYVAPFLPNVRDMSALRRAVEGSVDLDLLTRQTRVPLFVAATHIASGSARLFTGEAVTLDALMASACLPELFAAVEIDGEQYWDGGFTANPALEPLLSEAIGATDMIVVQITPFTVENVGGSVGDVMRRVSDISFNACLRRDLRALSEVQDIARAERSRDVRMRAIARVNLHLLSPPDELAGRSGTSKVDTRWSVLQDLRQTGRAQAEHWLSTHHDVLGRDSSFEGLPEEARRD